MKRKLFLMATMLVLIGMPSFAQLNGSGFYRMKNASTGRYITMHDNKGSVKRVGTGYEADLGALEMMSSLDDVISDPGSVIYLEDLGSNAYELKAQGVYSKNLLKGYQLTIGGYPDGTYRASVKGKAGGMTGRVILADDGTGATTKADDTNDPQCRWYIIPVNNTGENYFAAAPELGGNGKYYTTLYTGFAYQLSPGMKAYYASAISGGNKVTLKEIIGKVPAATPVVLECQSQSPAANKLLPIDEEVAAVSGNKLVGVYFNMNKVSSGYQHTNQTAYDSNTMRMASVSSSGALTFSTSSISTIPANQAYLKVATNAAATLTTTTSGGGETTTISVIADDITMVYGDKVPTLTYTVSGGTLTGTPELTCTATSKSPVGTYPIVITKGSVTNGNVAYYNGTLTIVKAPLTISVADYSRKRGEQNPVFQPVYAGFKNDESFQDLMADPVITTEAKPESNVGVYDIVVSGAVANNYEISYQNGKLNVEKVTLQVSVDNYAIKQGEDIPEFEIDYQGFILNEDLSVIDKKPVATTTAVKGSEPGKYDIIIAGGEDNNYDFEYSKGTLTVTPADAIIVKVNDASMVYGDAVPQFTYEVDGGTLEGEPVISCDATSASPAGKYTITVEKGTVTNYNVSFVNGTLTIGKAKLVVSVGNYERDEGQENPEFVLQYEGFKNGEDESVLTVKPVAATSATVNSPAGEYDIIVSGGQAQNYDFEYVNGKLTVNVVDAIQAILASGKAFDIYSTSGVRVRSKATSLEGLPSGLYIVNGYKVAVK